MDTSVKLRAFWDYAFPQLQHVANSFTLPAILEHFDESTGHMTMPAPRAETAVKFAMCALLRQAAIDVLLVSAAPTEVVPLVRSAFEDWVNLGFMLSGNGDDRVLAYLADVHKDDRAAMDGFKKLVNDADLDSYFPDPPPEVRDLSEGDLRERWSKMNLRKRAEAVELDDVYDYAYRYMCAIVHGAHRRQIEYNEIGKDLATLIKWGVWAWWFQLRILILAANELGIHTYDDVDQELTPLLDFETNELATCVLKKEVLHRESATT